MTHELSAAPSLSVVVETSTWHTTGSIQLADALAALRAQTFPAHRIQIVVVVDGDLAPYASTLDRFGVTDAVTVPPGTGYYEAKRRGVERADGPIVAFVDADNLVPRDWADRVTTPFLERPDVVAVMGRHRFRHARLSRFWDMLWWDRAFSREGPIDKLGAANNVAVRRDILAASWYPDIGRARGTWERAMTDALRRHGTIWFAPAVILVHDYEPDVRNQLQRAYARGFNLLAVRRAYPRGLDARIGPFRWLLPVMALPWLLAKDVHRLARRFSKAGYGAAKLPGLLLALLLADIVSVAGMIRSLRRPYDVEPP